MLRQWVAVDGQDRHHKLDRDRQRKQRDQRAEAPSSGRIIERKGPNGLEREIEQEPPDDRVDAEERDPPDVQVPIVRVKRQSQRRHDSNDRNPERRPEPPIASPKQHRDHEQAGSEEDIEPFLDRETPGDGIEIDVIGGDEEILDVEEITREVGGHQVAGHERDDDERDHVGRDGAHPAPDKKHAEVAPWPPDHPIDDLRGEHEAAEDEKDLDAGDRGGFREGLKRRVQGQVVRDRDSERRPSAQQIERSAALHLGGI